MIVSGWFSSFGVSVWNLGIGFFGDFMVFGYL